MNLCSVINGSALLFRLLAPHIAKFTRPFDEASLPLRALLNGCGLVAKLVDRLPSHFGSLGRALVASARRRRLGAEGAFDEAADRFGTRRAAILQPPPVIKTAAELRGQPNSRNRVLPSRWPSSFFSYYSN